MLDINNEELLRELFFKEYSMDLISEMAASVLVSEDNEAENDFESVVVAITGILFQAFMLKLAHKGELPVVFENGKLYRFQDFTKWKEITGKSRDQLKLAQSEN